MDTSTLQGENVPKTIARFVLDKQVSDRKFHDHNLPDPLISSLSLFLLIFGIRI
jgi:hypothetical protein